MLPPTSAKASAPDTTKTAFDNVRTGRTVEVQVASDAVAAGTMYYIGHNENFGNYRSTDPDFVTAPAPPRACASAWPIPPTRPTTGATTWTSRPAASASRTRTEADDVATVASGYGAADYDHDPPPP